MAKKMKNKADDGKRTEIISVRLDPKLRYLAELAARKHRRALSNCIEWAIAESMKQVYLPKDHDNLQANISISDMSNELWDIKAPDRFVKLAFKFPELLTLEEQVLLEIIRGSEDLWSNDCELEEGSENEGLLKERWLINGKYLLINLLRKNWDALNKNMARIMKAVAVADKRTEIISVRLDPKLRYLTELAARKNRRTLSNYIEWAVAESIKQVYLLKDHDNPQVNISISDMSNELWDIEDSDRFVKLAFKFPELLTLEEQVLLEIIRGSEYLWSNDSEPEEGSEDEDLLKNRRLIDGKYLLINLLRKHWDAYNAVVSGEEPMSILLSISDDPFSPDGDSFIADYIE